MKQYRKIFFICLILFILTGCDPGAGYTINGEKEIAINSECGNTNIFCSQFIYDFSFSIICRNCDSIQVFTDSIFCEYKGQKFQLRPYLEVENHNESITCPIILKNNKRIDVGYNVYQLKVKLFDTLIIHTKNAVKCNGKNLLPDSIKAVKYFETRSLF